MIVRRVGLTALIVTVACGDGPTEPPPEPSPEGEIAVEKIADGLFAPTYLTAPANDPRLFVTQLDGVIRIIENDELRDEPFLDLSDRVSVGEGERGLLGLAFHPFYAANGYFFVNYTDHDGNNRIERFRLRADDPYRADPDSGELILYVEQPNAYHNGGELVFGPDGMLYVGIGDGTIGGDPHGVGQDPHSLLASVVRIDVLAGDPYRIPLDNPFADGAEGAPEVWHYGLRHAWRFGFDEPTGMLYLADVGESSWEEINVVPWQEGGHNFGWPVAEGPDCFREDDCDRTEFTGPVVAYPASEGCSVIGGYVYRGEAIPWLQGTYLYADHCRQWLRGFRYQGGEVTDEAEWDFEGGLEHNLNSFGRDASGELYLLNLGGGVFRIVDGAEVDTEE